MLIWKYFRFIRNLVKKKNIFKDFYEKKLFFKGKYFEDFYEDFEF